MTATVPELRQPPHDPLTLLLGGRLGWPLLAPTLVGGSSLSLAREPASLRRLTEPSGSLGGLRPPANVAVSDAGEIWLLEPGLGRLLQFDPCACAFVEAPCGLALNRPSGLALAAGHLFVCDTGNQCVRVMLTPSLVISGVWKAPMEWEPTGVAIDGRFRVHVVDPRNGLVHHFGWSGRYLGHTAGVGASRFIAVDSDGDLVVAGLAEAYRVRGDVVEPVEDAVDGRVARFPSAPYPVSAEGSQHLGPLCLPPNDGWYDLRGRPSPAPAPQGPLFERTGSAVLGPLDSLIDECLWHRVELVGDLPDGCSVSLDTCTAQVPLSAEEVDALPEQAWETRLTCTALTEDAWDGLVRSPRGRYLWIRLRLAGNGSSTPRLDEAVVEFPRISLRRFLPAVYGAEPTSADFTDRLLAIVDRSLRDTEDAIDGIPGLLDPYATPYLDWLASWIGLRPDHRLPEALQRRIVGDAGHLLDLRGTVTGLRRLLLVALGLDTAPECRSVGGCRTCPAPRQTCPPAPVATSRWVAPPLVLEHFRLRRWFDAGASTLGDTTVLWGQSIVNRSQLGGSAQVGVTALKGTQDPLRDPFHVYAHKFTVFVPASARRTEERRRAVEQLVAWGSPAHTLGHVEYVDARMRIGIQSSIGFDTVVGRLPAGVTLGETRLGPASVLDGNERQSIDRGAVGTTTVLG